MTMTTATKRRRRPERPKMTEAEAKTFTRLSVAIYAQIIEQLACDCEPYADTFTFNRWIAQGMAVRKGEHGIKFHTFVPVEGKTNDDPEAEPYLLPRTLVVFCRHQVEAKP